MIRLASMGAALVAMSVIAPAMAVDFEKEIRPIFAEKCYQCHGPEKDKGDLRLHAKAEILDEDYIIVAGKPEESEIYKRVILPPGDDDVMPPEGKAEPLTAQQQELLKKWIAEGADFGQWTIDESKVAHQPQEEKLPEVAAAPAEALARLQEAGALAMPLAQNTNLLNVDFRAEAANTGDPQLALLRPIESQVAWLGLGKTQVTDGGLEQIKGLKNLRKLDLHGTGITDAGLAHLAGLQDLRYVNLYDTKITDAGLDHLKGLKNLKKLYVWQTGVTPEGASSFAAAVAGVEVNRGWEPPPPATEVAGANMLTNADFEEAADGKPAGWLTGAATPDSVQFTLTGENPKSGKSALKIAGGSPWAVAYQKFPVEAGKAYNVTGFIRLHKGSAMLTFQYSKGDEFLGNGSTAPLTTAGDWQQVSATSELDKFPQATHFTVSAITTGDFDADFDAIVLTVADPAAAAAPAPAAEFQKFAALAAGFKADSCCAKAHAAQKVCDHPCCKEALAAGKVCEKCNPK